MGSLIKYIPYTITTGFTAGIAVTIFIGQIKDFLGLTVVSEEPLIETMDKLMGDIRFISTINVQAVIVGAVCLAILIVWPMINATIPPSLPVSYTHLRAPWCVYCRRLAPAMEKVAEEYKDILTVGTVNIDNESDLARREKIEVVPDVYKRQIWCSRIRPV